MAKKIITRIISPATTRMIELKCPSCAGMLARSVDIDKKEGKTTCYTCGAKIEWKEEE